jgi:DNA (cytosine-5)-methyltransferase 1
MWWPTPTAIDATMKAKMKRGQKGRHAVQLSHLANSGRIQHNDWWLWPTPTARLGANRGAQAKRYTNPERSNDLDDAVAYAQQRWPTPTARDHKDGTNVENVPVNSLLGRAVKPSKESGALNPTWVEWLMGFPSGWTDLEL